MSQFDWKSVIITVIGSAIITTLFLSVLIFTVPAYQEAIRGPQGLQGKVGPMGPKGEQGLIGQIGPAGTQGEKGIQGASGERGFQGIRGLEGVRGIQGLRGEKGDPYAYNGEWRTVFVFHRSGISSYEDAEIITIESDFWRIFWYTESVRSAPLLHVSIYEGIVQENIISQFSTEGTFEGDVHYVFGGGTFNIDIAAFSQDEVYVHVEEYITT